jgi:hypothetical protein
VVCVGVSQQDARDRDQPTRAGETFQHARAAWDPGGSEWAQFRCRLARLDGNGSGGILRAVGQAFPLGVSSPRRVILG